MSTLKKPELDRLAAAGGVNNMTDLLREREQIGAELDRLAAAIGDQYQALSRIQMAIGQELFYTGACPGNAPAWLGDSATAYRLRNRLGVACVPHSSGGGNESPFGPVYCRFSLQEVFGRDHEGFGDAPSPQTETVKEFHKRVGKE